MKKIISIGIIVMFSCMALISLGTSTKAGVEELNLEKYDDGEYIFGLFVGPVEEVNYNDFTEKSGSAEIKNNLNIFISLKYTGSLEKDEEFSFYKLKFKRDFDDGTTFMITNAKVWISE